ncbi:hypothetical protein RRG08_013091 [Elysia crispata]|uniref:Uncharacterized protein n=1 Tax=Elysia crispata TaxID=231223 RepID=A0AAE1A0J0_9GAST|nr:hypothetical protein RRG08_013091 [Elysia crispata]
MYKVSGTVCGRPRPGLPSGSCPLLTVGLDRYHSSRSFIPRSGRSLLTCPLRDRAGVWTGPHRSHSRPRYNRESWSGLAGARWDGSCPVVSSAVETSAARLLQNGTALLGQPLLPRRILASEGNENDTSERLGSTG